MPANMMDNGSQSIEIDHHQSDRNMMKVEPSPNAPKDIPPPMDAPRRLPGMTVQELTPEQIRAEAIKNRGGALHDKMKIDPDTRKWFYRHEVMGGPSREMTKI